MKKAFFGLILTVLLVIPAAAAFAQTAVGLDEAIQIGANEIEERLARGSNVVVLNFNSASQRFSNYVLDEMMTFLVRSGHLTVVDRANLEIIQREMNFQLSGDVSDSSAQAIGQMLGAQSIVSGSIEDLGNFYRVRFRTIHVETAAIQVLTSINVNKSNQIAILLYGAAPVPVTVVPETPVRQPREPRERNREPREDQDAEKAARFNTLGVSVGSAIVDPVLIVSIHGTFSPIRNMFIEVGFDYGFISVYQDIDHYFSMFPYVHVGFFQPFRRKGGFFVGAGGGYMVGRYDFYWTEFRNGNLQYYHDSDEISEWAVNFITGINLGNFFNVSYTLRTNFASASNKVALSYVYRFK
jgi:TolB-like protein